MKIENRVYVIMKVGNMDFGEETAYMKSSLEKGFTNDIRYADKFADHDRALIAKQKYDLNKNNGYESDLKIVPLKTTYEW